MASMQSALTAGNSFRRTLSHLLRPVRGLAHDLAADHRQQRRDIRDLWFLHRQRIGAEHGEICELAGLERALLALVEGQIGAVRGRATQRLRPAEGLPAPTTRCDLKSRRTIVCWTGPQSDIGTL